MIEKTLPQMALFAPNLASAAPEMALTSPHLAVTMTIVALKICAVPAGFLKHVESSIDRLGGVGGLWGIGGIMGESIPQSMWSHAAARLVK